MIHHLELMILTKQAPSRGLSGNSVIPSLSPLIGWIDRELVDTYATTRGSGGDTLLRMRRIFSGNSLNAAVGGFYRLLPRLERNHFLLSYRIRRWISVNYEVEVSDPLERVAAVRMEIRQSETSLAGYRGDFSRVAGVSVALEDVRVRIVERVGVEA